MGGIARFLFNCETIFFLKETGLRLQPRFSLHMKSGKAGVKSRDVPLDNVGRGLYDGNTVPTLRTV